MWLEVFQSFLGALEITIAAILLFLSPVAFMGLFCLVLIWLTPRKDDNKDDGEN